MKKRIAILIAIMMIATMMPITAFAAKETRGVCTIGKTAYTSVEAAINAVKNGQTITLLDNVESIGVDAKDKMFTIDLNTKTVGAANVRGTGIVIGEVGALRLVNGQVIGDRETGTIDLAKGILIIEDVCSINGNSSQGYAVNNIEGTVRIISGEFTAHADSGSNAIYTGSKAKTTLDVGSITDPKKWETAKSFAATVDSTPDVILDGVTYADTDRAMEAVKSGSTMVVQNDISWFSIDTGDADFTLDLNGKTIGSTSNGSCLYVDFSGTVKIVNGNIITGDTDWGALWILSGKVVLEDVNVTNTDIDQTAVLNEGGELEIISGTFTSSSKNYPAVTTEEGATTTILMTAKPSAWETAQSFTVSYTCKIGETKYGTVAKAIEAVENGQTITLTTDVDYLSVNAPGKEFTLDLNGKTLGAENVITGVWIENVGEMTLKNGTVIVDEPDWATIELTEGKLILDNVSVTNSNNDSNAIFNAGGELEIISGTFTTGSQSEPAIKTAEGATTVLGTCTVTDPKKWTAAQTFTATVDSTPDVILDGVTYADTDRAMEAVKSGSTMVVQNDISWFSIDTGDADFTLDLNGKTIGSTSNGSCLYVDFSGTVKIVNGNIITGDTDWGALWILSGKVVLEDVKVTNTDIDQTAVLNEGGELEIISGTFTSSSKNYSAVTTETTAATSLGSHTVSNVSWADAKEFTAIDLKSKKITLSQDKYTYDGTAKRPEVTVEGVDPAYYNVTYKNNINAGTATVVVSGKYNSSASITKTFTIEPVAITETALIETTYKYNGSEKMPAVTVKAGASTVASGITADTADVDVTYAAGRKNAGTYEVTVTGRGNYTGTITKSFTIEPATITEATLSEATYKYNASVITPAITVKAGVLTAASNITADTEDVDVTYASDRKNAGTYEVTVTGKGNYTGTIIKTFTIEPAGITGATLPETTYKYSASAITPAITVKAGDLTVAGITEDTSDFDVTYASDRKNVGTYEVTVTGRGNYAGAITQTFVIEPAQITEASLSATALTFNNKARKPYVTVKAGSLKAATKISADTANIDLTYPSGRKNVGKYTITIKGKGNYTGTIKKTFKINPKGVAISKLSKGKKSFTVKWKKPTKTYRNQITGYQIRYSTSSKMSNAKIVKVKSKTATTKTIKKLKAKKKYYVQVRTYRVKNGVTYTSAWSTKKYIKTK